MLAFVVAAGGGGGVPSAPTIGTATAGDQSASVAFTPSSYLGKGGTVTYTATSSPGGFTASSTTSPITVFGLGTSGTFTFTVVATTSYGTSSAASASSNGISPNPPAPPPPPPPAPSPCASPPFPNNCTFVAYTCDPNIPTYSYEYYDCGQSQTCPGTGGYYQALRPGICGYNPNPPVDPCAGFDCGSLGDPVNNPGNWSKTGNYQACIPDICGPYKGEWESYVGACGCGYGLFVYCNFGDPSCPF